MGGGHDKSTINLLQMRTEMHTMRVRAYVLAVLMGLVTVSSVHAGWHEFWDRVHLDFHRSNCWGEPFNTVDRNATRTPFSAMIRSGWQTQNTLGLHYFDRETHALNEAGQRKLFWILNNAPDQFRTIYVSQSVDREQSEKRVDSVQQNLAQMTPGQALPPVIPVAVEPRGWPAEYIDHIDRRATASIPDPRLPQFKTAGGGGG